MLARSSSISNDKFEEINAMKCGFKTVTALAIFGILATSAPAHSQQYPTKVVRVIVPFAPGGGSDITARQFSQKLSEGLGQQFPAAGRS